ncbi:MAG: nucleotidyl transferase AbiEii/AbiGii toxin family protein [Paludibacteraceae bacterium]|nr:nucleotidyl transferase AbiEii/AbiGii toxin family protein [Paludibacteraceae bacterium]
MLSIQTIQPDTLELLKRLASQPELTQTRLVGGTALALLYGHRKSIDLDFFGVLPEDKDDLIDMAKQIGNVTVINKSKSIVQTIINDVKVDFVDYSRYSWIVEPIQDDGFVLASDKDIAALKVNAIMGRGTRKDFVDLYFLLQHYSLEEILSFYKLKYPEYSEYRALLSMTYFEDAEMQEMPIMLINTSWDDMKKTIIKAVNDYQKVGYNHI